MANTGSFNTTAYEVRYLTFDWSIKEQSIENNYSVISWSLKGAGGSSSKYYRTGNFKVIIDGETVYESKPSISLYHQEVASGTKTIYHNVDGTRSFSASVSAGIYWTEGNNSTGSGSWSLTDIPRKAVITGAPNFNDEEDPTIYYDNPLGTKATNVEACISLNGDIDIPYRAIPVTGTSYTFHLSEAERNILRNGTTTSNSRTVYFYIRTTTATEQYTHRMGKTLSIINAHPTMNPVVYDTNQTALQATGNKNNFISGYSDATFTINAKAHKGATITAEYVVNGSQKNWNDSGTLKGVESGDFIFTVADSRGNTVSQTIKKNCYPYVPATVAITGTKLEADGTLTISFTGNLYRGTFGKTENDNKHFAYYQIKEQGGNWSGWTSVSSLITFGNYGTYTVDAPITGLNYTKTYVVKAAIEDSFTWRQTEEKVVISRPVFDWSKDDFRFNCSTISGPVYNLGGIPNENFIPEYSDFNDYIKPGIYCASQSDQMPTMKHAPCETAGRLICVASLGNKEMGGIWSYLIQRFVPYTSAGSWKRVAYTGSTPNQWDWGEWVLEFNSNDTDYIVAQGKSGVWEYRKWNSGRAECWGSLKNSGNISEAWGSDYCGVYDKYLDYPFTFVGYPTETATLHTTGYGASLYTEGSNTTNHSAKYGVLRSAPYSGTANITVDIYVCGKWK